MFLGNLVYVQHFSFSIERMSARIAELFEMSPVTYFIYIGLSILGTFSVNIMLISSKQATSITLS